ncbi:MAG TPA: twin transmembrane helix small protein [Burkholderiaceae bacterium]|nr:twin transmembrane helix small protein [Burkholderiaceae bacterium]
MKPIIGVVLVAIVAVLGAALVSLMRDRGRSDRMLNLLRLRVAVSAALIAFIWFGYYMGWIHPHSY